MYDVDAIEAINIEQLVTATDRLLLSGPRRRPSMPRIPLARGSAASIAVVEEEPTVFVRAEQASLGFAARITIVSAALGVAIGTMAVAASMVLGSH